MYLYPLVVVGSASQKPNQRVVFHIIAKLEFSKDLGILFTIPMTKYLALSPVKIFVRIRWSRTSLQIQPQKLNFELKLQFNLKCYDL